MSINSFISTYPNLSKQNPKIMASPIILILGAGPNIGQSVAKTFLSKGYKVALATRSAKETESTSTQLNIKSDFSVPSDVESAFEKTTSTFGTPSVVVYNGTPPYS